MVQLLAAVESSWFLGAAKPSPKLRSAAPTGEHDRNMIGTSWTHVGHPSAIPIIRYGRPSAFPWRFVCVEVKAALTAGIQAGMQMHATKSPSASHRHHMAAKTAS